jgi:septum formation protein
MLARLSGRAHVVVTACCLIAPDGAARRLTVATEVVFRALSDAELQGYVASGEWRGKAGAYAAQGIAAAFIPEVRGSYTNVVGLPLAEVVELLASAGAPGADPARGVPA